MPKSGRSGSAAVVESTWHQPEMGKAAEIFSVITIAQKKASAKSNKIPTVIPPWNRWI